MQRKMVPLFLLAPAIIIAVTGCNMKFKESEDLKMRTAKRPEDFSLSLSWSTGHMAYEEDMYRYGVTIGPTAGGLFTCRSGDRRRQLSENLVISVEELDQFYQKLVDIGALTSRRQKGDPIDGGPVIEIAITAGGRHHSFPCYSEASNAERTLMDGIVKETENLVPAELWKEMNRLRVLSHEPED